MSVLLLLVQYQHILTEKHGEKKNVAVIQLNRPKSLNALCEDLMNEVSEALDEFEADDDIGCIILTGSEKAFAGMMFWLIQFCTLLNITCMLYYAHMCVHTDKHMCMCLYIHIVFHIFI